MNTLNIQTATILPLVFTHKTVEFDIRYETENYQVFSERVLKITRNIGKFTFHKGKSLYIYTFVTYIFASLFAQTAVT